MTATYGLLNEVEDAMASGSAARRGKIVRHVTDLFIVGSTQCTEQEIDLFDDVLTRLAAEIETSARALLAVRLAPVENAPPRIIHALAFDDEIDVAGPVLEQSVRLDERALLENARQKGQAHLLAISRRQALSEQVTDVLVERGDQQVVLSTAENRGARFSAAGFSVMVRRADGDDRLAASVGARPEIPQHLYNKLLAKASKSVRAKLEAAHPQARREVRQVIEEVTERLRAEGPAAPLDYGAARAYIDALQRRGQLDERKLEMISSVGRFEEIAVALSVKCQLPLEFVERALTQERSETLLIIAKAGGLPWSTVKAMLTGRALGRHASGGDLAQALASYERLKAEPAREIVRFHRMRAAAGSRAPS
jgi:uncharacterized protein (DUF2336 family)